MPRRDGHTGPVLVPDPSPRTSQGVWEAQWARVPQEWRRPAYRLDQAPASEVFVRNSMYLASSAVHDFTPTGDPRLAEELAWWVWTCWAEGHRKVEPSMLRWWVQAVTGMAATRLELTGRVVTSLADLDPTLVAREADLLFRARNGHAPSPGNQRNLVSTAEHIHLLVSVRCTERAWWEHDVWDLTIDPRVPRREHEPLANKTVRLGRIRPTWLREGLRFWLRTTLTHDVYTWTSVISRAVQVGSYFGRFCSHHGLAHPAIALDPDQLRPVFTDFLAWMRSPAATSRRVPLSKVAVNAVQSQVQSFYAFMYDCAAEAAKATGDPRWRELTTAHTRLWSPAHRSRRVGATREQASWIATADLQRMVCCLDVLGAPTNTQTTVSLPDGQSITSAGLGDEQAMRAWLLQAMTGRRASEILMLDFDPLTAIPGLNPTAAANDAFVARLRYQQTKVDGVDPTILVEQAVVNVITEQQTWARERFPDSQPRYLFLNPRHNHRGLRPRSYPSYVQALKRLDAAVPLLDSAGQPLRFTQTHRLRHTRATELLNAGVPVHVVQRYLGHRSPEMTMRYAATLAATAEAEFLRYKKVGADGRDLNLSPHDVYDMAQLDRRTDRILPNGWCLLPPAKSCDKGNACLSCGHFATDRTQLDELRAQHQLTETLIHQRQRQFRERNGVDMGPQHVWLAERLRELASLQAVITRLEAESTNHAVRGAGTSGRAGDLLQIDTSGAHAALLHARRLPQDLAPQCAPPEPA